MTKKKLSAIIIIAVVLVVASVSLIMSGALDPYEREIKLGYKLLEEGNYEEAILVFNKAIEIDAKRERAYIGKADVFVARGDEKTLDDVKAVLSEAYNNGGNSDELVAAILRLSDELMAKGQSELALALLTFGYDLTGDDRISAHKGELFDSFAEGFLADLYGMFVAGDEEGVKKEIQSDKYLNFVKLVDDIDYKYIYFPEKNTSRTGKGIALYYVDNKNFGKVFVYYGDFVNGLRSGNGIWAGANGIQYYWFEGAWSDDAPNGEGTLLEVKDESKIQKEPNHTYPLRIETSGSFKNGLYHGTINEIWYMDIGDKMVWAPITAIDGVFQEMNPIPSDIASRDYAKKQYAEGNYIVSISNGGAELWWNRDPNYIVGFKD